MISIFKEHSKFLASSNQPVQTSTRCPDVIGPVFDPQNVKIRTFGPTSSGPVQSGFGLVHTTIQNRFNMHETSLYN